MLSSAVTAIIFVVIFITYMVIFYHLNKEHMCTPLFVALLIGALFFTTGAMLFIQSICDVEYYAPLGWYLDTYLLVFQTIISVIAIFLVSIVAAFGKILGHSNKSSVSLINDMTQSFRKESSKVYIFDDKLCKSCRLNVEADRNMVIVSGSGALIGIRADELCTTCLINHRSRMERIKQGVDLSSPTEQPGDQTSTQTESIPTNRSAESTSEDTDKQQVTAIPVEDIKQPEATPEPAETNEMTPTGNIELEVLKPILVN